MKLLPGDLSPDLASEVVARRVATSVGSRARGRRIAMNQAGPAVGPFQNVLKRTTGMEELSASKTMDRVGRFFSLEGHTLP